MVNLPDLLLPKIKHFGLSIERNSLHAVELNEKGKPVRLSEIQLSQGTFSEGSLVNPQAFTDSVKKIYAAGKFSTPYVAVCFPEVFAYTRGYDVPKLSPEEVNEAISWHAKDLFPFPEEDVYFDWKVMKTKEKEYQTSVVAVQKNTLDPLVKSLTNAGLYPLRFEPDASALARLIIPGENIHVLLIDVNPQGAYVTLVEGEKAMFTTVVNYSAEDNPTTYLTNIDQTLNEISTFYKNKGKLKNQSTQVIITGQMASEDWVKHVEQLLGFKSQILNTKMEKANYNKAYAAALAKIEPPLDPQSINLMPYKTQKMFEEQRTLAFYKSLFLRASFVVGLLCFIVFGLYVVLSFERKRAEAEVKTLRKLTQIKQSDTQSLLLLNAQAQNIVALAPLRKTPIDKLNSLEKIVTENIVLSQWEFDDARQEFKLTGVAKSREDLLDFKTALDSGEYFSKVTLPLGSLETPVNVPFVITFLIKI